MIINRKKIWELSWPIILANFSIPLVGLVDTLIMGHMPSSDYLAAVALGGIIFNFMYAGLNFLRMGTTGIIAQYHCLLYTSPSPRDWMVSRMPSSA